ncbi:MAG: RNA polymerase sporulation sigma factor SigK [Clostridia bacterium]|nr:RNA polymerase sporulation sigma factor SigK [Clostridia bacterium]
MLYLLIAACAASLFILSASPSQSFPPVLSQKEEAELFKKMSASHDMGARDKLIIHNQRLVSHIVRKYYGTQKNVEDLLSIGTIGLIKSIDTYNPDCKTKFATYAAKCIQNEILMYFRSQKKLSREVSINDTIDIDKDGNPLTYMDIVRVEDNIAEELDIKLKSAKALAFIGRCLDQRERQIICMRYGLKNRKALTQREVAEKLGISRSYVSRIEKGVLDKIRRHLEYKRDD